MEQPGDKECITPYELITVLLGRDVFRQFRKTFEEALERGNDLVHFLSQQAIFSKRTESSFWRRSSIQNDTFLKRRAVVSLVKICGAEATDALIGLFTTREFNTQSHDYKLSLLLAIRNLGPQAQRDMLGAIFRMRSFLRRSRLMEMSLRRQ